jgi:hypothetical protein
LASCATCVSGSGCVIGLKTCASTPQLLLFDETGKVVWLGPGLATIVKSTRDGNDFSVTFTNPLAASTSQNELTFTGTINGSHASGNLVGDVAVPLLDEYMHQEGPFDTVLLTSPICDTMCATMAQVGCVGWKSENCPAACALAIELGRLAGCGLQASAAYECLSRQPATAFACDSTGNPAPSAGVCEAERAASNACSASGAGSSGG